jgi:hypothetical protein
MSIPPGIPLKQENVYEHTYANPTSMSIPPENVPYPYEHLQNSELNPEKYERPY